MGSEWDLLKNGIHVGSYFEILRELGWFSR